MKKVAQTITSFIEIFSLCLFIFLSGCLYSPANPYSYYSDPKPKPRILRDVSSNPSAVKIDSLSILVEPYRPTEIDTRKLGLCATLVTFQTPPSECYTFNEGDIVGIGKEKYLPYTFSDLLTLIQDNQSRENSRQLDMGTATALVSSLVPMALPFGAAMGIMAAQSLGGLATGGTSMYNYGKNIANPLQEIVKSSGFFPLMVSGRESKIFYFPSDVHTIEVSVKGKPILFPLVASTASPSEKLTGVPAKISKAYATKDSGFIHHRNCPKIAHLLVGKELIEFTSLEEALQAGGKSCETCKDYFQK